MLEFKKPPGMRREAAGMRLIRRASAAATQSACAHDHGRENRAVDRPRPGTGYLSLLAALAALGLLTCGLAALELRGAGRIEWIAAIIVIISVGGLIAATVDAAFRTRYEISGHELRLRSGFVIRAVIPCRDVATVERVGLHSERPRLGWRSGARESSDRRPSHHAALESRLLREPVRP